MDVNCCNYFAVILLYFYRNVCYSVCEDIVFFNNCQKGGILSFRYAQDRAGAPEKIGMTGKQKAYNDVRSTHKRNTILKP